MKKVILIMGHLASLKTTMAKKLATEFNIMHFCKDDIKEILVDQIGYRDRAENLKLSHATFFMMSHAISNMQNDGVLLLESNFKYHELDILREKHQDVLFISLFLTGDVHVLYDRYLKRQENRHIAHLSTGEIPFDIFKDSMFSYESKKCLGKSYLIDTTDDNQVYENIKKITTEFLQQ